MNSPVTQTSLPPVNASKRTVRMRYWHEAIIDDMLIHPKSTVTERCARLGYHPSYLSRLMNSDMFKAAYEARRQSFTHELEQSIVTKLKRVADTQLDVLQETIEKKRDAIPFLDQVEGTKRVLEALGFGPKQGAQVVVQNGVTVNANASPQATSEQIAEARANLRAVENMRVIGSSSSISQAPSSSGAVPKVIEGKPEVAGE